MDEKKGFGRKHRNHGQAQEVINRNTVVSLAIQQGFNAFLPVFDDGIDFILYRESDGETRLVQLKGRWTIDKKYIGRNIWVAFPSKGIWYLAPHDLMLEHATRDGRTETGSWRQGTYSIGSLSEQAQQEYSRYRFAGIAEVAAEATATAEDSST